MKHTGPQSVDDPRAIASIGLSLTTRCYCDATFPPTTFQRFIEGHCSQGRNLLSSFNVVILVCITHYGNIESEKHPLTEESYPYSIHTNRELELMLAGKKPLAVFGHDRVEGFEKSDALAHQDFAAHLKNGPFTEHLRTYSYRRPDGQTFDVDYWFYAAKGEEWRVDAYCLLLDILHKGSWCSHLEWLQGTLLGYTQEQNRYHLSRKYAGEASDH